MAPVVANWVRGDLYRIADQPYDSETERWEFLPEDLVRCGTVRAHDGEMLAATSLADAGP